MSPTEFLENLGTRRRVVFLLIGVLVVAGAATVFVSGFNNPGDADTETATVQYTLETTSPGGTKIELGPTTFGGREIAVNNLHHTPTRNGVLTYARITVPVETEDGSVTVEEAPFHVGQTHDLSGPLIRVPMTITGIAFNDTFNVSLQSLTMTTRVRNPVANEVSAGDSQQIEDREIAKISSVQRTGVGRNYTQLRVEIRVRLRTIDGNPHYAGDTVRLGREIRFHTASYEFEGTVVEIGNRTAL